MASRKILISGATGFVGKHLSIELFRRGFELVYLLRRSSKANQLSVPGKIIYWETLEEEFPKIQDLYGVVHLAGESIAERRWTKAQKKKIISSRVETTEKLVQAFKKTSYPPQIFLSISAVGIYGDRKDMIVDENTTVFETDFLSQVCIAWEKPLSEVPQSIRTVIFRLGVVLGRDGGMLSETITLFKNGLGSPLGNGKQWLSWIHIDDLIASLLWALEKDHVKGVFNAVAPKPVRNSEFTQIFAKTLKKRRFLSVPSLALKVLLGERASFLLSSTRTEAHRLLQEKFTFRFPTLESALENLLEPLIKNELKTFHQWLPSSPETLFSFFSDEKNLESITPPWLNFKVVRKSTPSIEEGTRIEYRLRIRGVPARWVSQIESWNPPHSFIDRQIKGPYALWHHSHLLETIQGGTLMTDIIRYRLPFGKLGWLVKKLWVEKDIKKIFNFRREKISREFRE